MMTEYAADYSIPELLACFLAHDLEDGDDLNVGASSPIARAAVLLAHFTHGPNMTICLSYSKTNILNVTSVPTLLNEVDYRLARWAESYFRDEDQPQEFKKRAIDRPFFIGALQVDKYGNSNLIGIGKDYHRLDLRGPGPIGTTGAATGDKHYYIVLNTHNKRMFVEKCDYISSLGWGEGGVDGRKKCGILTGGPRYVLTPLCIMDFEEQTKKMRLKSLHPGVTIDEVVQNTGFELVVPGDVPGTQPPTGEEIEILRTRIDREGVLRR
ncbi:CoA-transferase [Chloroflexota bacterium]